MFLSQKQIPRFARDDTLGAFLINLPVYEAPNAGTWLNALQNRNLIAT
jgi:hypothetical protein